MHSRHRGEPSTVDGIGLYPPAGIMTNLRYTFFRHASTEDDGEVLTTAGVVPTLRFGGGRTGAFGVARVGPGCTGSRNSFAKSSKRSSAVPSSPRMLLSHLISGWGFVLMELGLTDKSGETLSGLPSSMFANGSILVGENVGGRNRDSSGVKVPN